MKIAFPMFLFFEINLHMVITHFLKVWSKSSLKLFGSDSFGIMWLLFSLNVFVLLGLIFLLESFKSYLFHINFNIILIISIISFKIYFSSENFSNTFLFHIFRKEGHIDPKYTLLNATTYLSYYSAFEVKLFFNHLVFWLTSLWERLSPIWWFTLIMVLQ